MARIFITGSTDGLGFLAAKRLIEEGHKVYLHARNEQRAEDVRKKLPDAERVFIADFSELDEVSGLADQLNKLERMDAIIQNAGIINALGMDIFTVNVLAPYLLTAKASLPKRLIFLSSSMHKGGKSLQSESDISKVNYSDSKLHLTTLTKAVARLFPEVYSNAVDPGWVPTKMGGKNAPDDLLKGCETQVWLSVSDEAEAQVSGEYFFHKSKQKTHADASDTEIQERLLDVCENLTGIRLKA